MTLVGRHFILGGFLYRKDAEDEIAIEDGYGAGGRRGEERKRKRTEVKNCEEERKRRQMRLGRRVSRQDQAGI
jgi:hypothetical protein